MTRFLLIPSLFVLSAVLPACSPPVPSADTDKDTAADANPERAALRKAARVVSAALRQERIEGLPSPEQMKRLAPLFTPELAALVERARVLQQEQSRRNPDEKPDWIEGDLFGSLFEGVTGWEIGDVFTASTVDGSARVRQTYREKNREAVTWTDTLYFKKRDGRWLLDDIRMGGKWAFRSGDSLRARLPGGGRDADSHTSPDGRWEVAFVRDGETVKAITVRAAGQSSLPVVLYGRKGDKPCPGPTWVVWGPDDDTLAIRLGDSPRFTRTLVYQLSGGNWKAVLLPEFFPSEKKTLAENGFTETDRLVDPGYWRDARTLVVKYFGSFAKNEEGDGYHKYIAVRIGDHGTSQVLDSVDVPGED